MRAYDVRAVEAKWRDSWEREGVHRAPLRPDGPRYFSHDAAPFPTGPLHLGHVRTYALGDMTARYQRLLGKAVLYHTGFDAFGLPNELAAIEAGISPREYTRRHIRRMSDQLERRGISYDWSCVPSTCDPQVYRWTQWLFLEMFDAGLVFRREATLNWCPGCETTLARLQVENGACWRCRSPVERRSLPQWFIQTSRYAGKLRESLDGLTDWSDRARRMIAALLDENDSARAPAIARDWPISRQRSWDTPVPMVHCPACGTVPVPRDRLPVVLPDDLDWQGGAGALSRSESFVRTTCPRCDEPARRETETIDCFFDDIWCFLQALVLRADPPGFRREAWSDWIPVDLCHSGLDTYFYFHLYRFLGLFMVERKLADDPELIRSFRGSGMLLAGGRKMSTHYGNAIASDALLDDHGADALRVALLWASGPQRDIDWNPALIDKAVAFLDGSHALFVAGARLDTPPGGGSGEPSRALRSLERTADVTARRMAGFIESYRANAALEELGRLRRRLDRFVADRLPTGRLLPADHARLTGTLSRYAVLLAPFAPHLAEEGWSLLRQPYLVAAARWPGSELASMGTAPVQ